MLYEIKAYYWDVPGNHNTQLYQDFRHLKPTPGLQWEVGKSPLYAKTLLLYPSPACFWKYCIWRLARSGRQRWAFPQTASLGINVKSLFCSLTVLLTWMPSSVTAPQPSLTGTVTGARVATHGRSPLLSPSGFTFHHLLLGRCFPTFLAVLCVPFSLLPPHPLPLLTRSPEAPNTNSVSLSLGLSPHLQVLLMVVPGLPVASHEQVNDAPAASVAKGRQAGCNEKGAGLPALACWARAVPCRVLPASTVGLGEDKHRSLDPLDITPIKIFCCTEARVVFYLVPCIGLMGGTCLLPDGPCEV